MKRLLALTLAALMLLFMLTACSDDGEEGEDEGTGMAVVNTEKIFTPEGTSDNFHYDYVNGDEVVITGYDGPSKLHAITVPSMIDDRPVTEIANNAFSFKANVNKVTLPDGIRSIGDTAFAGTPITEVNIPETVTHIGAAVFAKTLLTEIYLPDSVTALGMGAFTQCTKLVSATLSAELIRIEENTFMGCEELTTVVWGDKIAEIGEAAFAGCKKLANITFGGSLEEIGDYAFAGCFELVAPVLPMGVVTYQNTFYGAKQS